MEWNLNGSLKLNTSMLKERGKTYTSLTDLYKVPIFTAQAMKKADTVQQEKKKKETKIQNGVFLYKETQDVRNNRYIEKLFSTSLNRDKKIDYRMEKGQNLSNYYMVGSALLGIIFILSIIRYSNIKKKKRTKYEEENYE